MEIQSFDKWLISIGLDQYGLQFIENHLYSDLPDTRAADEVMGVAYVDQSYAAVAATMKEKGSVRSSRARF